MKINARRSRLWLTGLLVVGGGRARAPPGGDPPGGEPDASPVPPDVDAAPDPGPDAGPPPTARVIPIYIAATDNSQATIDGRRMIFDNILDGIQEWYGEVMGEPYDHATFYYDPVRVLTGHYTVAEWQDFGRNGFRYPDGTRTEAGGGCSMYYGAIYELQDRGLLAENGLPALGDGVFYYVVNGGGDNGSCGAGHYLGASEAKVLDDAGAQCPTGRKEGSATDCHGPGVIAHEGGHGFGLPHASDRPMCTGGPSVMDFWWNYDNGATLCEEDKVDLAASGYFVWRADW